MTSRFFCGHISCSRIGASAGTNAHGGAWPAAGPRARTIAGHGAVCNSSGGESDGCAGAGRGAEWSRAAERAAAELPRCFRPISQSAETHWSRELGCLGLPRTRSWSGSCRLTAPDVRLEAECGRPARGGEPWRKQPGGPAADQAQLRRYAFAWAVLLRPPRWTPATNDCAYSFPAANRFFFFGRQQLVAGQPVHVAQDDDATGPLNGLSLVVAASQVGCPLRCSHTNRFLCFAPASPISRSPRRSRASCALASGSVICWRVGGAPSCRTAPRQLARIVETAVGHDTPYCRCWFCAARFAFHPSIARCLLCDHQSVPRV